MMAEVFLWLHGTIQRHHCGQLNYTRSFHFIIWCSLPCSPCSLKVTEFYIWYLVGRTLWNKLTQQDGIVSTRVNIPLVVFLHVASNNPFISVDILYLISMDLMTSTRTHSIGCVERKQMTCFPCIDCFVFILLHALYILKKPRWMNSFMNQQNYCSDRVNSFINCLFGSLVRHAHNPCPASYTS